MSDVPPPHHEAEPSDRRLLYSATGWIGVILIFVLILAITYYPNRPDEIGTVTVEQRKATLAEVEANQDNLISEYAWVNEAEGVVRLPIERAMELAVRDLSTAQEETPRN